MPSSLSLLVESTDSRACGRHGHHGDPDGWPSAALADPWDHSDARTPLRSPRILYVHRTQPPSKDRWRRRASDAGHDGRAAREDGILTETLPCQVLQLPSLHYSTSSGHQCPLATTPILFWVLVRPDRATSGRRRPETRLPRRSRCTEHNTLAVAAVRAAARIANEP